jgi:hypothetical protein
VRKPAKSSCDWTSREADTTEHEATIKNAATLVAAPAEVDQKSISELIRFFKLLDKWDREVGRHAKVM